MSDSMPGGTDLNRVAKLRQGLERIRDLDQQPGSVWLMRAIAIGVLADDARTALA